MSLKEDVVRVRKVGPSLASALLHPGWPLRQGEMESWSYKTFLFNVGEEDTYLVVDRLLLNLFFVSFFSLIVNMTITGTLEWVRSEYSVDADHCFVPQEA